MDGQRLLYSQFQVSQNIAVVSVGVAVANVLVPYYLRYNQIFERHNQAEKGLNSNG